MMIGVVRPGVARAAATGLVVLTLGAVVFGVGLLDARYLILPAVAVGIGILIRTVRFGRWAVGVVLALILVVLFLGFWGSRGPHYSGIGPDALVSIRYSGKVDASGATPRLIETVVCDRQFQDNLGASPASLRMPDGWQPSGTLDGAPIYVRTTALPSFGDGRFGVDQVTIGVRLGAASVGSKRFRLVPADGSVVTIKAPKGAVGNSDPPADQVTDLPGGGALLSVKTSPFGGGIDLDVLGTALRNPAGRILYEGGAWGYLPWALSALVLACAALAADVVRERIRAVFGGRAGESKRGRPDLGGDAARGEAGAAAPAGGDAARGDAVGLAPAGGDAVPPGGDAAGAGDGRAGDGRDSVARGRGREHTEPPAARPRGRTGEGRRKPGRPRR